MSAYSAFVFGSPYVEHPDVFRWLNAMVARKGVAEFVFIGPEPEGVPRQVRAWCDHRKVTAFVGQLREDSSSPMNGEQVKALIASMGRGIWGQALILGFPCPRTDQSPAVHAASFGVECHLNRALLEGGLGDL